MVIVILDIITFIFAFFAFYFFAKGRKQIVENDIKLLIFILISFLVLYSFLLWSQWSHILDTLEGIEDFLGALMPMFFAFLFYALIKHAMVEKIHRSEKLLRITLNSSSNGVISVDRNGKILAMNPMAEKITGWRFDNNLIELKHIFFIREASDRDKLLIDLIIDTKTRLNFPNNVILTSKKRRGTSDFVDCFANQR